MKVRDIIKEVEDNRGVIMDQTLAVEVHPTVKVILEGEGASWSAYVPSIPGCISTGHSQAEVTRNIERALTVHLDLLRDLAVEEERRESVQAQG
jgi:predicted RNase H-like HicB family nuclease